MNHNGEVCEVYVDKVAYGSVIDTELLAQEIATARSATEGDVVRRDSVGVL